MRTHAHKHTYTHTHTQTNTHWQANRKFQVILLEDNRSIVLCKHEARACHDEILKRHRISEHVQL